MAKDRDPYRYAIFRGMGPSSQIWDYARERWTHLHDSFAPTEAPRGIFEIHMARLQQAWRDSGDPEILKPSREKIPPKENTKGK